MSGVEENPEASIPESSNATKEEASDPVAAEEREAEPPTVDDAMAQEQQDVTEKKESDNNLDKEVSAPKQEEENPMEEEVKPKEEDGEVKKSEMTSPEEPAAASAVAATDVAATVVVVAAAAAEEAELSPPEKADDKADNKADEIKTEEKADEIKTEEKAEEIKIEDKTDKMEIDEPKIEEKSDVTKPDETVEDGIIEESPPADKIEEEKVEKVVEEGAATTDTPEKKDEEMKEEATTTTTSEKKDEGKNNEERTNEDVIPEKKDEEPTPVVPTPNVHPTPEVPPPAEAGKDQETASSGPEGDDDTSKAEDQSVGYGQNEEGERTDDAMDTEDQNTNRTDPAEEQSTSSKGDLPYSTRGRSTGNDTASANENWERGSALETLEEIGRAKESTAPPQLGTSFLEALSEEQRRTRTRFLPEVEGMHILRKTEVKDDLALARSLVLASGVTSLKKSKAKKSNSEDDAMDVDEEDGGSPSEDDRSSDIARRSSVIEFRARDLVLPSGAFRAPKGTKGVSNEDGMEEREDRGGSKGNLQSPSVVESVTAFNPPRPPESIGAKKKHRMLRWERRPEDVEIDLNNYRKTVQRTRQELHSAEAEFIRLQTIDAHLRWHYLNHLNLMNEEYLRLNDEFSSVQQECVKAADLLTSRTRSRGAGKGSYVMRDVLTVLKTRGAEAKDKESMNVDTSRVSLGDPVNAGVGGLASLSFNDWSRSTAIEPMPPASSWIVEGENVKTPYGDGVVLSVHPAVDYTTFSGKPNQKSGDEEKSSESASGKGSDAASKGSKRKKDGSKPNVQDDSSKIQRSILPARVSVKLKYGTGHFTLDAITPIDNPAVFSDAKLASRWKSMVDSALCVSGCLDVQGMTSIVQKASKESPESESSDMEDGQQQEQGRAGASQEDSEMVDATDMNASGVGVKQNEDRPLPFGSSMLPTSGGRGNSLQNLPIVDVEEGTNQALFEGKGVLGETTNQGVTDDFRKWEDDESEYVTLQASVLQLRNALVRQKRIRMLNEKTSVATSDRYRRAEELVSEMRSDLKSLKQRLEQELNELGIDEATAEQILSSYYEDNEAGGGDEEEEDAMESSPSKRRREEGEGAVSQYGVEDADRESYHSPGTDGDFSRDDLDSRPTKKIRANQ